MEVELQALPNGADLAHQFLVTSLGAGGEDFDVFVLDVVWVAEFARAGWLADLSDAFPPARVGADFLAGPAAAVVRATGPSRCPGTSTWGSSTTGPISSRSRRARTQSSRRRSAPRRRRAPGIAGYVWQGRQYEGLVLQLLRGDLGSRRRSARGRTALRLDTPAARAALAICADARRRRLSPRSVVTAAEEESRRAFQEGRAGVHAQLAVRVGRSLQRQRSPVRGKVGVTPLPRRDGGPGPGRARRLAARAITSRSPPARRARGDRPRSRTSPRPTRTSRSRSPTGATRPARGVRDRASAREAPFIAALLPSSSARARVR